MGIVGSLFVLLLLPVVVGATPLDADLASRGSPIGGLVLAAALGLALRMGRRRQRG